MEAEKSSKKGKVNTVASRDLAGGVMPWLNPVMTSWAVTNAGVRQRAITHPVNLEIVFILFFYLNGCGVDNRLILSRIPS